MEFTSLLVHPIALNQLPSDCFTGRDKNAPENDQLLSSIRQMLILDSMNVEMVDVVTELPLGDEGAVSSLNNRDNIEAGADADFELHGGIEFESHETAYSFYQEYAKSMGFTTSIKNSRRSKKSKEFIDAKFACSRYGISPESEGSNTRRPSVKKTDCKASMHVKRRSDGKWVIYSFIKEHNHELLPALAYHFRIHRNVKLAEKNNIDILHAVSERTRKMYVEMSRQSGGIQNIGSLRDVALQQFDKGRHLSLGEGDAQFILEYFKHVKKENPNFFYAIDLNEEQRLRNLFWVDAKSRVDYNSFSDVVSFDSCYIKSNDRMPFAPFVGVNHHFQPILLGCALVADETKATFVWLLRTWLRAMGGQSPKVIITDHDRELKLAIEEVLSNSRHCYSLSNILEKLPEALVHVIQRHEKFWPKFNKCIFKSWTEEDFDLRWWKMVSRFELQEYECIRSLYDDRDKWVPSYLKDIFLAGLCSVQRSDSLNSFLDKYIHKKISLKEFVKQYGNIVQNRYEEEAMADFDTWHKQPALKSPSPWEKQVSVVYTHGIFKKFQVEVLGVVGCHFKKESNDGTTVKYRVQDCEKNEDFLVVWNKSKSEVSCLCRSFEYKGFLCRHAMIVLQICGVSSIPPHYILKRWTKDAKSGQSLTVGSERMQNRVQRYNDLCKRAIELSEEGYSTQESYNIAFRALVEALRNCVHVNDSNKGTTESGSSLAYNLDENEASLTIKSNKKRNTSKKRKVREADILTAEAPHNLQHLDNVSADGMALNRYYGTQHHVQGLVQLNLMEPPHDAYYVSEHSMQGLGQLSSLGSGHDTFFGTRQSVHEMGHLDFRTPTTFSYSLQDDASLRSTQLHGSTSRNP